MVGQTSDKLCGRQEQPFVNRVCMKFEYITIVPYSVLERIHAVKKRMYTQTAL